VSLNGGGDMTRLHRVIRLHVSCLALLVIPILTPLPAAATDGAYTQDQAARGKSLYSKHCATCPINDCSTSLPGQTLLQR